LISDIDLGTRIESQSDIVNKTVSFKKNVGTGWANSFGRLGDLKLKTQWSVTLNSDADIFFGISGHDLNITYMNSDIYEDV